MRHPVWFVCVADYNRTTSKSFERIATSRGNPERGSRVCFHLIISRDFLMASLHERERVKQIDRKKHILCGGL